MEGGFTATILLPVLLPVLVVAGGALGGYLAGALVARIVVGMLRVNLSRLLEESDVGMALRKAGVDVFSIIGGLVKAFVFSLVFLASVEYVGGRGAAWNILRDVAIYLPRLVGGVAVLLLGLLFASTLSRYTGRVLKSLLSGEERIAKLVELLLALSLIAVVVTIALNLMLLQGDIFYPLMLGVILMGIGVYMGDVLVDELVEMHPEFKSVAPYAKYTVYLVFITTGLAAIFARFTTVASTVSVLAWGVVAATAILLFSLIRRK